jgi:hypothetical protein
MALLAVLTLTLFTAYASTQAPPTLADECQTFSETGFTVCGKFLIYWKANGGLSQQGFPISNVFEEKNADPPAGDGKIHKVQYFQRARFEEHTENQPPYDVLLGLIGTEQFTTKYQSVPVSNITEVQPCQLFSETGFKVCGRFLEYWKASGGLAQQGFPISGLFEEKNADPPAGDGQVHIVQYFQRARFEAHNENQPPNDVLLGLLGAEQFKAKYPNGTPPSVSPPPATTTPVATTPPATTTAPPTTSAPATVSASGCLPATSSDGVQACVSNASPTKNSNVTVYGRLVVGGKAISGATMNTSWHYKTTTSSCSGTSGTDGVASCTRDISRATSGYTVNIDVVFTYNGQSYSGSTSFTPQ